MQKSSIRWFSIMPMASRCLKKTLILNTRLLKISGDQILMNNDTQLCVFSLKGHEKFNGNLDEGSIKDVFKIDANRYQVIVDSGIKTIKLS